MICFRAEVGTATFRKVNMQEEQFKSIAIIAIEIVASRIMRASISPAQRLAKWFFLLKIPRLRLFLKTFVCSRVQTGILSLKQTLGTTQSHLYDSLNNKEAWKIQWSQSQRKILAYVSQNLHAI